MLMLPIYQHIYTPPSRNAATTAYLDRRATTLSDSRINALDAMVSGLVAAGVWAKLDVLSVTADPSSDDYKLNLKSSSFTLGTVNSPTFNANLGVASNGTNSYHTTGYQVGTSGSSTQNNHTLFVYVNTNTSGGTTPTELGVTNTFICARTSGNNINTRSANSSSDAFAQTDARGLTAISRSVSTGYNQYKNGVLIASPVRTSSTPTAVAAFLGARNNAGTPDNFSVKQVSALGFGVSLDATEHAALNYFLTNYLVAIGAK